MQVSSNFFVILEQFEKFVSCPYLDSVKIPTIGIGSTRYPSGKAVTMQDKCITKEYAIELVKWYVKPKEAELADFKLTQNQFDAVMSFIYNVGLGAFNSSTLKKKLKINPNDPSIKDEFMKWVKAGGKVLLGLQKRRAKEAELYFKK